MKNAKEFLGGLRCVGPDPVCASHLITDILNAVNTEAQLNEDQQHYVCAAIELLLAKSLSERFDDHVLSVVGYHLFVLPLATYINSCR